MCLIQSFSLKNDTVRSTKMRLKVQLNQNGHQNGAAVGVGWLNNDTFVSCGDDKQLLQWNLGGKAEPQLMERYKG